VAKAFLVVRSVVSEPLRERFDHWYASDHLPRAVVDLAAEKGWRFWSETDAAVHYAVYRFADTDALTRGMSSEGFRGLVADYDRVWPDGVTRTREIVHMAGEVVGCAEPGSTD
jgi:hypothetical protein